MTVYQIVADVVRRLDEIEVRYVIGGSLASSTWGQDRHTQDADLALLASDINAKTLTEAFSHPYYLSETEVQEVLTSSQPFRCVQLMHMDEAFKIDLFVIGNDEYSLSEIDRGRLVEIEDGTFIRYAAPENIVIVKLRWYVLGNRVSDKQWNDIVQVLEIQKGRLDEEYMFRWAKHFEVFDLLQEAMSQIID